MDDSDIVRQQLRIVLNQAGYRVLEAANGGDGLVALDNDDVSLVICDLNMPGMNGVEMLEHLQREQPHVKIPIVMLTTEGRPAIIERARRAGARGWIVKPFKPNLMVAAIQNLLSCEC